MAEVSQGYEAAIRRGREYGAAGDWAKALTEFIRAAQIAPAEIVARYHLAYALLKLLRYDQAMQQFEGIVRNQPQHIEAWQRMAEIHQQTGKSAMAVQTYRRVLEIHKKNERYREAAEILRIIIQIDPGQITAYRELMDLYKARGDRKNAALLTLKLGKYQLSQSLPADARSALKEALLLYPGLPEAEELKQQLGATTSLAQTTGQQASTTANLLATQSADEYTINRLIGDAEEALARGDTGPALKHYEMAVEAGANRADVFYSIGQLYAETGEIDLATDFLRRATSDHDYAASAFFSMGQIYAGGNRLNEAATAYRDALNMIDLQTIGREEVDELVAMYAALGEVLEKQGRDSELAELYNRLASFVTTRNLRTEKTASALVKAREINNRLRSTTSQPVSVVDEAEQALFTSSIRFGTDDTLAVNATGEAEKDEASPAVMAATPIGSFALNNGVGRAATLARPRVRLEGRFPTRLVDLEPFPQALPYVRAAGQFLQTQLYYAATDACLEMIRYFPNYLPSQAILAEVLVAQNRLEPARSKYQYIVDIYQLRQQSEKSIECYKRLSELSPDNLGLHSKLANLLMQHGHQAEAAEVLLATIANFVNTGQLERALEECKKLRSQAPQSPAVRVQYAELLLRLQRYSEALPELEQALEFEPDNPRATALVNITHWLAGDIRTRWNSLQTVIDLGRQDTTKLKIMVEEYRLAQSAFNHPGLAYAFACVLIESKQGRPALRVLQQAIEQSKNDELEPLLRWQLGELYLDLKEGQSAVMQLSLAANLIEQADPQRYADSSDNYGKLPSQVWVYCKLANAYEAQGNSPQAIQALQSVKKLMPYNRAIHKQLAELNFNQGQISEALAELNELSVHYEETEKFEEMFSVLREMVELAPNNIGVRDKLSAEYLKHAMIDEGLQELDELAELQRKNGRLKDAVRNLQQAAETNRTAGRLDAAYELYERIVRISPGDINARQQLVEWHQSANRLDEAVAEQRTIAQICLQANNTEEALAALREVISMAPADNKAYFQLAGILSSTGEFAEAYQLYEQLLNMEPGNEKARNLMEQAQRKAVEAGQTLNDETQPGPLAEEIDQGSNVS